MKRQQRIKFMNIYIDNLNMHEAVKHIDFLIKNKSGSYVVTPNVDHIVKLQDDNEFLDVYKKADLVLADGMPIVWISNLYGTKLKQKISGSDLFPNICQLAVEKKYSIFLLGASEGVAKKAKKSLENKYKGIDIVGTYSPPYGFESDDKEINKIISIINKSNPDILIVGLGAPKQEKFIYKYRSKLNAKISLGLGASIDFEAGKIKRCPKWVSNIGFEWLYRFFQEPKRMYKRYFVDDMKIIKLIWKYRNENCN